MKEIINKETAMQVYNIYSQIETCDKLIADLEKFIKECEGKVPDVIDESYKTFGSISIAIPYFAGGKFQSNGARIFNINYSLALKVIKSHKRLLKKRLEKIQQTLIYECSTEN